jgi:hypothetical protein
VGLLAFATTFRVAGQSGKFEMIQPFASLAAHGVVAGVPRHRYVTGLTDPAFRLSVNFIGAPALTAAEFKDYRQDFILGASLRITAPLGQYDDDKLVNIGSNRWSFKPEIGFSKAFGRWTFELAPAIALYTDNDDFFGGHTRSVSALYSAQAHISYTLSPGFWLGLDAAWFTGGRSSIDDLERDDEQEGTRFGATLSLPINRHHSMKFYGILGFNPDGDQDFRAIGLAWQYRWGGGY